MSFLLSLSFDEREERKRRRRREEKEKKVTRAGIEPTVAAPRQPARLDVSRSDHSAGSEQLTSRRAGWLGAAAVGSIPRSCHFLLFLFSSSSLSLLSFIKTYISPFFFLLSLLSLAEKTRTSAPFRHCLRRPKETGAGQEVQHPASRRRPEGQARWKVSMAVCPTIDDFVKDGDCCVNNLSFHTTQLHKRQVERGVLRHCVKTHKPREQYREERKVLRKTMAVRMPGHLRWPPLVVCDHVTATASDVEVLRGWPPHQAYACTN